MSFDTKKTGKYVKSTNRRHKSIWLVLFADVLLVGIFLLIFAFFHHVLPAAISKRQAAQEQLNATVPAVTETLVTEPAATDAIPEETVPETTALQDNRTPWQIKFAEHFTDQVVRTANSYTSPNVSVTVQTITQGEGNRQVTYHVADIYVGSMENFTTYTANNEMRYFGTQDVLEMDAAADAIISISGDFLTYQKGGFLMRNGQLYASDSNYNSICVLYADGTMKTYEPATYQIQEIIDSGAVQVWSFGPVLLDEEGNVKNKYNMPTAVSYTNPRSAIGYYEPGHYCFVIVDGRQNGYSRGMEIPELAQVFKDLGCTSAYNLDGGGSAVMVFGHETYSRQSNGGRGLGDILVIRESESFDAEQEVQE